MPSLLLLLVSLLKAAGDSGIDYHTQILTKHQAAMDALSSKLGSGETLKGKINSALTAQSLKQSTGVTPGGVTTWSVYVCAHVCVCVCVCVCNIRTAEARKRAGVYKVCCRS